MIIQIHSSPDIIGIDSIIEQLDLNESRMGSVLCRTTPAQEYKTARNYKWIPPMYDDPPFIENRRLILEKPPLEKPPIEQPPLEQPPLEKPPPPPTWRPNASALERATLTALAAIWNAKHALTE